MAFTTASSPHLRRPISVTEVMFTVTGATLPALAVLTWYFGFGYLINITLAVANALICEALVLVMRKRPLSFYLKDGSAILTAWLLGLALPPFAPWWLVVVGSFFAIVFVKHLFGGMGNNPFNPAMAAYALLLISFPVQMTTNWGIPAPLAESGLASFAETLAISFTSLGVDGFTMATPLDTYKTTIDIKTQEELALLPEFSQGWLPGWLWVSLAYLLGGAFLIWRKIITWHTPVAVLAGIALMALLFSWDPDSRMPITLHLLGGATMIGAFFIATDPVTSATSNKGKLIYGFGIGALTYIIRTWGNYPDAIAFAVLLMNFAAPLIDHYTRPRTYGHSKPVSGYKLSEDDPS
mgnify:FL=1